jgi:8-oxo-dGTP pyrophosphatase MutT (NUDIX family)
LAEAKTTYDGSAISDEPPFGAAVVVYRAGPTGREFLVLHRAHNGKEYAGAWAWTPPAGARQPGEAPEDCAARELQEETGLRLAVKQTDGGSPEWYVYVAEAQADAVVITDAEHDGFAWLTLPEAAARCQPERVAEQLRFVGRLLEHAVR